MKSVEPNQSQETCTASPEHGAYTEALRVAGSVAGAALMLGLEPSDLVRRLEALGIEVPARKSLSGRSRARGIVSY